MRTLGTEQVGTPGPCHRWGHPEPDRGHALESVCPQDSWIGRPRGFDGVPGEGAIRQARRSHHPRHGRDDQWRMRRPLQRSLAGSPWSRRRCKAGGRGKAGGVKLAKTPDEAFELASKILGRRSRASRSIGCSITPATPPEDEYYFSFLLDRANRQYLCIASVEGGVEIEEVAKTNPDAVKKIAIDPGSGVDAAKARAIPPKPPSRSRSSSRPSR